MELFKLENDIPTITVEARSIEVYKDMFNKYGKDATKYLSYIYFTEDYRSPFTQNYKEDKRDEIVKKRLGISDTWREDYLVKRARQEYREDQVTSSTKALEEVRETLHTAAGLVRIIRKGIDATIESENRNQGDIEKAIDNLKKLLDIANTLPKAMSMYSQLQEDNKKQLATSGKPVKKRSRFEE